METSAESVTQSPPADFPSLSSLRRAHTALLRRRRSETPSEMPTSEEIADFMIRARRSGRHIAASDSRDTIQGIIDYWYGILVLGDRNAATDIGSLNLDEFDGSSEPADPDSETESRARAEKELAGRVRAFDETPRGRHRPLLRRLLLRLFTLSESRNEVRLTQLQKTDEIFTDPAARDLAAALLAGGLLKTESAGAEADGAYVLTDVSLWREWPAFHETAEERRSLRDMAGGWERSGRLAGALLDKGPLLDLSADYVDLKQTERDFLSASREVSTLKGKRRQNAMRTTIGVLAGLLVCVIGLVIVFWMQRDELTENARKLGEQADQLRKEKKVAADAGDVAIKEREAAKKAQAEAEKAREEMELRARNDVETALAGRRVAEDRLKELLEVAGRLTQIVEGTRGAVEKLTGIKQLSPGQKKDVDAALSILGFNMALATSSEANAQRLVSESPVQTQAPVLYPDVRRPVPKLVKVLKGHNKPVNAVAFAKDGRLATAGDDNSVHLWQSTGEEILPEITGSGSHGEGVNCLAFSPDGRWLAIGSQGSTVRLRDLNTGTTSAYPKHADAITSVSFSPDGKWVLSASADKSVQIWDPNHLSEKPIRWDFASIPTSAVFNSDATQVVCSLDDPDKAAFLWAFQSDAPPKKLPMGAPVKRGIFSADGKLIAAAGSGDKKVAVWKTGSETPVWSGEHAAAVFQAVFDHEGKRVASASADMTIKIWGAGDGKPLATLMGHQGEVRHLAVHPAQNILLSGSSDTTAKLWFDAETEARYTLTGHSRRITSVAFNRDGTQIATGSYDGTVRLWDFKEAEDTIPPDSATGWCLYGWLDTKSSEPNPPLRAQSFTSSRGKLVPEEGDIVTADAIMNIRDEVKPGADNKKWDQGKPVDILRKGEKVTVVKVLQDKYKQPPAVWIQFKKAQDRGTGRTE